MNKVMKCVSIGNGLLVLAVFLGGCTRDPQHAKAKYLAEGRNYMKKGNYGDAALEFQNAIRIDPSFVDAYYQLAQADLARQDYSSAYASLEKAFSLDPNRVDVRLDRGRLYLGAQDFHDAEDEAKFIIGKEKDNVAAHQLLGAALIGQNKREEALKEFTEIAKLSPADPSAFRPGPIWLNSIA